MPSHHNFHQGPPVRHDVYANREVNGNKRKRLSEPDVSVKRRRDHIEEPYRGIAARHSHVRPQSNYGNHGGWRQGGLRPGWPRQGGSGQGGLVSAWLGRGGQREVHHQNGNASTYLGGGLRGGAVSPRRNSNSPRQLPNLEGGRSRDERGDVPNARAVATSNMNGQDRGNRSEYSAGQNRPGAGSGGDPNVYVTDRSGADANINHDISRQLRATRGDQRSGGRDHRGGFDQRPASGQINKHRHRRDTGRGWQDRISGHVLPPMNGPYVQRGLRPEVHGERVEVEAVRRAGREEGRSWHWGGRGLRGEGPGSRGDGRGLREEGRSSHWGGRVLRAERPGSRGEGWSSREDGRGLRGEGRSFYEEGRGFHGEGPASRNEGRAFDEEGRASREGRVSRGDGRAPTEEGGGLRGEGGGMREEGRGSREEGREEGRGVREERQAVREEDQAVRGEGRAPHWKREVARGEDRAVRVEGEVVRGKDGVTRGEGLEKRVEEEVVRGSNGVARGESRDMRAKEEAVRGSDHREVEVGREGDRVGRESDGGHPGSERVVRAQGEKRQGLCEPRTEMRGRDEMVRGEEKRVRDPVRREEEVQRGERAHRQGSIEDARALGGDRVGSSYRGGEPRAQIENRKGDINMDINVQVQYNAAGQVSGNAPNVPEGRDKLYSAKALANKGPSPSRVNSQPAIVNIINPGNAQQPTTATTNNNSPTNLPTNSTKSNIPTNSTKSNFPTNSTNCNTPTNSTNCNTPTNSTNCNTPTNSNKPVDNRPKKESSKAVPKFQMKLRSQPVSAILRAHANRQCTVTVKQAETTNRTINVQGSVHNISNLRTEATSGGNGSQLFSNGDRKGKVHSGEREKSGEGSAEKSGQDTALKLDKVTVKVASPTKQAASGGVVESEVKAKMDVSNEESNSCEKTRKKRGRPDESRPMEAQARKMRIDDLVKDLSDEDVGIFVDPLSAKEEEVVNRGVTQARKTEKVASFADVGITLTGGDMRQLAGTNWLNDELINAYAHLINERNEREGNAARMNQEQGTGKKSGRRKIPSTAMMSSFFYARLVCTSRGYDYSGVRRWTKRMGVDVLKRDRILVPINLGNNHWVLGVIDMRRKMLMYLDSMRKPDRGQVMDSLRRWLCDEIADKHGEEVAQQMKVQDWPVMLNKYYVDGLNVVPTRRPRAFAIRSASSGPIPIPLQTDGGSCGVFTAKMADCLALGVRSPNLQQVIGLIRKRMALDLIRKRLPSV